MAWHHLLIDLFGCDVKRLDDEALLKKMFNDLSRLMEMHVIAGPLIVRYAGREGSPSGEGLSGFMIIAESHVSIHTDTRTRYASIDVYSCKEFDVESIENYLADAFKPDRIEKKLVIRGPRMEAAEAEPTEVDP